MNSVNENNTGVKIIASIMTLKVRQFPEVSGLCRIAM